MKNICVFPHLPVGRVVLVFTVLGILTINFLSKAIRDGWNSGMYIFEIPDVGNLMDQEWWSTHILFPFLFALLIGRRMRHSQIIISNLEDPKKFYQWTINFLAKKHFEIHQDHGPTYSYLVPNKRTKKDVFFNSERLKVYLYDNQVHVIGRRKNLNKYLVEILTKVVYS